MALTGKIGQMKYYLFKLLKGIVRKKISIQYTFKPLTRKGQRNYEDYIVQEKLLVKILKDCFNLDVDTALITIDLKRKWLLKKAGIKK